MDKFSRIAAALEQIRYTWLTRYEHKPGLSEDMLDGVVIRYLG